MDRHGVGRWSRREALGMMAGSLAALALGRFAEAAPAVSISITPASATVRTGRTKQFTAAVKNTSNTAVIWKVNGIAGGNAAVGTISTSGLYKAPNVVPNPATVAVSATAAADTSKTASASVTVTKK